MLLFEDHLLNFNIFAIQVIRVDIDQVILIIILLITIIFLFLLLQKTCCSLQIILWRSEADLPLEVVNRAQALGATGEAPGKIRVILCDKFVIKLRQSQVIWQSASAVFDRVDTHYGRIVQVLSVTLLLKLLQSDRHYLFQW